MESMIFDSLKELKSNKSELEKALNIQITIQGKNVSFAGEAINEYTAQQVLLAMQFGFSAAKALTLKDPEIIFRSINIKNKTYRKNLKEVRARIIGSEGKTKRAIENLADIDIVINEKHNSVGIIGFASEIDEAETAISNLIRGSKQANVYRYLERMNAIKKTQLDDLGLKIKDKKE